MIEKTKHKNIKQDGNDINYDLMLSGTDDILGTEEEVPTLKGKARIKVEPGTQPGKLLRMKERGIIGLHNNGTGDQYIRVNVYIPKDLSDEERKHIEALREGKHFAVSNARNRARSEEHTSELQSRGHLV